MPTYAYACKQCGHRFDAAQSFADAALTECPVCGGELKKEYGSIGVTFNGSGFYRTDSRAGSGEKAGSTGDSGGGGEGGSTDSAKSSGTDTKTSTSSDSKTTSAPASGSTGS